MEEVPFPNEVWLEIFKNIDVSKLMELRLVCHRFYDLIEYLLNKKLEWKYLARDAILYDCLEITMQRAYPHVLVSHWMDIDDPVLWRGTYLSYKKWQKVLVNPHTKSTIVPTSRDITCVCTFDKYIAIGFDNGSIECYTIDNISQPFYIAKHGTKVIQVEFWYFEGDVLVVSVGIDHDLKFWDLQNKFEIVTNGFFANSINSGECRHFCIGHMGGILTLYERVGYHIFPGFTLNLELRDDQNLVAHTVDGKYLMAMVLEEVGSPIESVFILCKVEIEGEKSIKLYVDHYKDWISSDFLSDTLERMTAPTVTFFFGISKNCIGSTNYYEETWHTYHLDQHFGCNVKSIALHAQILMFGLEDGSIHLLYIRHYGYVMELEERIKHSKKIVVDTVPIVDLIVLEVDKKPCIVAVTDQKVHLINFF